MDGAHRRSATLPLLGEGVVRILQRRLHILDRELRIGSQEIGKVGLMREVRDDALDRNACPLDHGFADHDGRVLNDAFAMSSSLIVAIVLSLHHS
jgi:hypothetical protein